MNSCDNVLAYTGRENRTIIWLNGKCRRGIHYVLNDRGRRLRVIVPTAWYTKYRYSTDATLRYNTYYATQLHYMSTIVVIPSLIIRKLRVSGLQVAFAIRAEDDNKRNTLTRGAFVKLISTIWLRRNTSKMFSIRSLCRHRSFPCLLPNRSDLFFYFFNFRFVSSSFVIRYLSFQFGYFLRVLPEISNGKWEARI